MPIRMRALARVISVVLAGLLLVGTVASPAAAITGREKKLFHRINKARTSRGIFPLKLSAKISKMAHNHSVQMAKKGTLFHSCLSCKFQGWDWHALGENVAKAKTIGKAHQALMNSPGHRANILSTSYHKVGVGVVDKKGWLWVTEIFYG